MINIADQGLSLKLVELCRLPILCLTLNDVLNSSFDLGVTEGKALKVLLRDHIFYLFAEVYLRLFCYLNFVA